MKAYFISNYDMSILVKILLIVSTELVGKDVLSSDFLFSGKRDRERD